MSIGKEIWRWVKVYNEWVWIKTITGRAVIALGVVLMFMSPVFGMMGCFFTITELDPLYIFQGLGIFVLGLFIFWVGKIIEPIKLRMAERKGEKELSEKDEIRAIALARDIEILETKILLAGKVLMIFGVGIALLSPVFWLGGCVTTLTNLELSHLLDGPAVLGTGIMFFAIGKMLDVLCKWGR